MNSTLVKRLRITAGVIIGLILLAVTAIYGISSYRLNRRHPVPPAPKLSLSNSPEVLSRGGHIATRIGNCVECHGGDLGGRVFTDAGPLGIIAGPNLTRGRGGIGAAMTDADWVRAIRHGIRRDGSSLLVMPSESFVHFAQDDLSALVSYLNQLTPVDREVPASKLRYLGRTLLVAEDLPVLVAEKTPNLPLVKTIDKTPSVAYGLYLANIGGCRGCHGLDLSGGTYTAHRERPRLRT